MIIISTNMHSDYMQSLRRSYSKRAVKLGKKGALGSLGVW